MVGVPIDFLPALKSSTPRDVVLRGVPDGTGDQLVQALGDVEFLILEPSRRADVAPLLTSMTRLRVVQLLTAGADGLELHLPTDVTLCRTRGARERAVCEWVIAALLGHASGLLRAVRDQHLANWQRSETSELYGCRVLIIGMGAIGSHLADRLVALGVEVIGVAEHARDGVQPVTALADVVPTADAVVVLTPLSATTAGLIDAHLLGLMRDGALVVNAGRGPVIDTAALLAELSAGRLNAVLDVVDPEPLPATHPLWSLPNCHISAHIAGATAQARQRAIDFSAAQLERYVHGRPLLEVMRRPAP